jgi:Do/DeqQ family serine protease
MIKKLIIIVVFVSSVFAQSNQSNLFEQFSNSFADIAEDVNESVVTITTTNTVQMDKDVQNFYRYWGRDIPDEYESKSLGSGVIVDEKNAYIVTNHHVIFDERAQKPVEEIKVQLLDKRIFEATVIGLDKATDLAVLQIEASNIKAVELGDSEKVRVGEWVLAIGSPFSASLSHTVTAGIVSALGRNDVMNNLNTYQNFIQTDAAINPGNSGGALLNMKGQLIGINAAIASGGGRANAGIGFAIPSIMVKKVMNDLIDKGYVVRSFLGIYMQDINEDLYEALNLQTRNGAIVSDIVDDSPASKSGLVEGDVIVSFEGKEISNGSELKNLVSSTDPGSRVKLGIYRDNKKKNIFVTLEEREDIVATTTNVNYEFGLLLENPSEDLINKYKLNEKNPSNIQGVIVTGVEDNSPAEEAGLQEGDIITRVGRKKIYSTKDFLSEMSKFDDESKVLFLVKRGSSSRFITLTR